jgi:DegV family protein with EDD domain
MIKNVAILTDSTAGIPIQWLEQYGIQVIPLRVHWEATTFLDGVDLMPDQFYRDLPNCKHLPTTSQPPLQNFYQAFNNLAEHSEGILVPLISSGISGTVAMAQAAAREYDHLSIEVIDTRTSAMGQALIILAAAKAAQQEKSLQEVKSVADRVIQRMRVFFTVETLKYLHQGGRINGASRFMGTALDIKPILTINSAGKIDALERVRTRKKVLQRMITLADETANGKPIHAAIAHAGDPYSAELLRAEVQRHFDCVDLVTVEFSPVIGVHLGPGAMGFALYTDEEQSI